MKNPDVVIIGLGYIGLPTSALIANRGYKVLGVDIDSDIIEKINNGQAHIYEPKLDEIVSKVVSKGLLKASLKPKSSSVYLIVVPTPFLNDTKPDISFVENAIKSIIPYISKNDLIIIESTSPVGTTEKMKSIIYEKRKELKDKIFIAYCPERVLPGNIFYELENNDRVVGGINEESTEKAFDFYSKIVKGNIYKTNSKTAEMCKLIENSSRDVQIAFANELSMVCDKAGIDVWELINLANKHPRVNILNPGSGVGGHCIAVDPYFIISDFSKQSKLISQARKVNNFKPDWCIEKIKKNIREFIDNKSKIPRVSILGLTFKANIDDIRESPSLYIARKLNKLKKYKFSFVEPNIKKISNLKISKLEDSINDADIIVFLVGHDEFRNLIFSERKIILDFCGITKS